MATMKNFLATTDIPQGLARAVIRTVGSWADFKEVAQDVARYGAAGGFGGFIYYSDTVAFTEKNRADIIALAKSQAAGFGMEGAYSMIGGFNSLRMSADEVIEAINDPENENRTTVLNVLAWYALEETARSYVDFCEQ